jgi:hypothetical protein
VRYNLLGSVCVVCLAHVLSADSLTEVHRGAPTATAPEEPMSLSSLSVSVLHSLSFLAPSCILCVSTPFSLPDLSALPHRFNRRQFSSATHGGSSSADGPRPTEQQSTTSTLQMRFRGHSWRRRCRAGGMLDTWPATPRSHLIETFAAGATQAGHCVRSHRAQAASLVQRGPRPQRHTTINLATYQ